MTGALCPRCGNASLLRLSPPSAPAPSPEVVTVSLPINEAWSDGRLQHSHECGDAYTLRSHKAGSSCSLKAGWGRLCSPGAATLTVGSTLADCKEILPCMPC